MRYTVDDYALLVGVDPETKEFVAVVREFPSLSWIAANRIDAAAGLRTVLVDVLDDMYANGEDVPTPQHTPLLRDLQPVGIASA